MCGLRNRNQGAFERKATAPIDYSSAISAIAAPFSGSRFGMEQTRVIQTAQRYRPAVRPGAAQCQRNRLADRQNLEISVTIQNQTFARALASIERERIATGLVATGDTVYLPKHDDPNSQSLISRVKTKMLEATTLAALRDAVSRQRQANGHFRSWLKLPKRPLCSNRSPLGLTAGVTACG